MQDLKRVLLIEPPVTRPVEFSAAKVRVSPFFPLGLGYLTAVLERVGYNVSILDCLLEGYEQGEQPYQEGTLRYGLSDNEIASRILAFKPDVVGVGAIFSAKDFDAKNVCRISKRLFPNVPTVLGGPHAGAACREIMAKEPAVDFVVVGEGEENFLSLLKAIAAGDGFDQINGLAWRDGSGVHLNEKSQYIQDLDTIPFPARHKVKMEDYFRLGHAHDRFRQKPFTQMITSRGCPFKCTFCALGNHWGRVPRRRSPANVLAEIDLLVKDYGVREIHFEDDNLTADKGRALKIFELLRQRNYDLVWTVPTGMAAACLDETLLKAMAASGCYSVTLAIESGDQEVLTNRMRKPVNLKKIPALVRAVRDNGMLVKGFFMLGFPGETKETIEKTIAYAKSLELDWAFFFIVTPLPYTEMYDMALREGYIENGDFNPLTNMHESVIRSPEFDNDYLLKVRQEALTDINFRNNVNLHKYDLDQAIRDFEHVVGMYPNFDFAQEALGEAYLKKGWIDKAIGCWEKAVVACPQNEAAQARLKQYAVKK